MEERLKELLEVILSEKYGCDVIVSIKKGTTDECQKENQSPK